MAESINTTTDKPAVWTDGTAIDINRVYPLVEKLRKENRALRVALRIKESFHE